MQGEDVKIGDSVKVVDEFGVLHDGLVTNAWGEGPKTCVNVLFMDSDPNKTDSCGRQVGRLSSCSHRDVGTVHGRYWYVTGERKSPVPAA